MARPRGVSLAGAGTPWFPGLFASATVTTRYMVVDAGEGYGCRSTRPCATSSPAFFESIHYFEVALRNTMDQALDRWVSSSPATDSWYRSRAVPLTDVARKTVRTAVGRATDGGRRPELPGRVVAEPGLGFWWSLLAPGYGRTLWLPCLRRAFPAARQQRLHGAVDDVRLLRNRIAHHEPRPAGAGAEAVVGGCRAWLGSGQQAHVQSRKSRDGADGLDADGDHAAQQVEDVAGVVDLARPVVRAVHDTVTRLTGLSPTQRGRRGPRTMPCGRWPATDRPGGRTRGRRSR